jgi:hypothetical protein
MVSFLVRGRAALASLVFAAVIVGATLGGCASDVRLGVSEDGLTSCPASTPTLCTLSGCVDLTTDQHNCGACDHACGVGEYCAGGACQCGANQHVCGNTPVQNGPIGYHGGPVVSHLEAVAVFWGGNVDTALVSAAPVVYTDMTSEAAMGWLDGEYNTAFPGGTGQHIYGGTFRGAVKITPSHTGTSLSDNDIESELASQIAAGVLPQPHPDTAYVVHLPPGVTAAITRLGLSLSAGTVCQGICGFHQRFAYGIDTYAYAVIADAGPACAPCDDGVHTQTQLETMYAQHELMEIVTDPYVGDSWQDGLIIHTEIGDPCENVNQWVTGSRGQVFDGQKAWSNYFGSCITQALAPDGLGQQLLLPAGTSRTVTVKNVQDTAMHVWLSSRQPMGGITVSLSSDTVPAQSSVSMVVTASAGAQAQSAGSFAVYGQPLVARSNPPTYTLSYGVNVTCPSGQSWCDMLKSCIGPGTACACGAGTTYCTSTGTCLGTCPAPPPPTPVCPKTSPFCDCINACAPPATCRQRCTVTP